MALHAPGEGRPHHADVVRVNQDNITFSSADLVAIVLTSAVLRGARRTGLAERIARLVGGSLLIGLGTRMAFARD